MKKLVATFMIALSVLAISSVSFANPTQQYHGGGHNGHGGGSGYCYNRY